VVRRRAATTQLDAMAKVATRFAGWRPATEVLTLVKSVPTIFPQVNRGLRVGGWPTQRIALVHGPSGHGKTTFVHGLGLSFLNAGHFYAYVDAEYTTPEDWLGKLMAKQSQNPAFLAMRPKTYEETVEGVRGLAKQLSDAKEKGEIPPETACFCAIDSIRKLVPEKLMAKLLKDEGGIDGASGRAAMMKAALNAQWLDELAPLAYHANLSILFIARETENPNASPWDPKFKVGGGTALVFDSSVVGRVTRDSWVKRGSDDNAQIIGEKHCVNITKTKVSGMEGKTIQTYFHTMNALQGEPGFDPMRDVFDLCLRLKIVEQDKARYSFDNALLGVGVEKAVQHLRDNPDVATTMLGRAEPGEGEIPE
jgi:RecA/RadA recombinase